MEAKDVLDNTIKATGGCWRWGGGHNGAGYPVARIGGRVRYVHRVIYELMRGGLDNNTIIRTCGNRWCVAFLHIKAKGREELEERFWSKVDRGDDDNCWEWQAATHHKHPNPVFWYDGEVVGAREMVWFLWWGEWPSPTNYVLPMQCMNPVCVNPHHLAHCDGYHRLIYQDQVGTPHIEAIRAKLEYGLKRAEKMEQETGLSAVERRALTGTYNEADQMERLRKLAPWRFEDDPYIGDF